MKKIMCFEWHAFSQDDLEDVIAEFGIEFDTFSYRFKGVIDDPYLYRNFKNILSSGGYDAVISWNFWPVVAQVCYDVSIPYIAWVYDCPISYRVVPWITYPTSYTFIFDRSEHKKYKDLGAKNAYHLPLAVNTKRIDGITVSEDEEKELAAEISFLGTMYESEYLGYADALTKWERGYLDACIRAQGEFFGDLIFNEVPDDKFLYTIMDRWNSEGVLDSKDRENFALWFRTIISRERTHRDRVSIIKNLAKKHDVRYYSYSHCPELGEVNFHNPLNYHEDMFKMFRTTKINLNITYRLITKGISLRALDVMAAGGFLLSNVQEEMLENFKPGVDFACYSNEAEAIELADYYLEHEDERQKIAASGHEAVARFDYRIQLKKIFDTVFGGGDL